MARSPSWGRRERQNNTREEWTEAAVSKAERVANGVEGATWRSACCVGLAFLSDWLVRAELGRAELKRVLPGWAGEKVSVNALYRVRGEGKTQRIFISHAAGNPSALP